MKAKKQVLNSLFVLTLATIGGLAWHMWWTATPQGIMPLVDESDFPYSEFYLEVDSGATLELPSGTRIHVPPNGLVRADGKAVGNARIEIREFKNAEDILKAGVPMSVNPNQYLESAGMIEVRAFDGEVPLALEDGASLEVFIASNVPVDERFRVWSLNESDWAWSDAGDFVRGENEQRLSQLQALDSALQIPPPELISPWEFEIMGDENEAPELSPWKGVIWHLEDEDVPPSKAEALLRSTWTQLKLKPLNDGRYRLEFTYDWPRLEGENARYRGSFRARPQLNNRQLKRAQEDYENELRVWEETLEERRRERDFVAQRGQFIYAFESMNLGYINIDVLERTESLPIASLTFDFEEGFHFLDRTTLFMVLEDRGSVLRFQAYQWRKMPIPEGRISLVIPLEKGEVRVVDSSEFAELVQAPMHQGKTPRAFELTTQQMTKSDLFTMNE